MARASLALLLALSLPACSSEAPEDADRTAPTASSTGTTATSGAPSVEPTPTEPPAPTVTPATGPDLLVRSVDGPVLRLRLPAEADWDVDGDYASARVGSDAYDIFTGAGLTAPGKGLGYYARRRAGYLDGPTTKRLPDTVVGGVEGFVIEGKDADDLVHVFGAVYEDTFVSVQFDFPDAEPTASDWIESILASAEWL